MPSTKKIILTIKHINKTDDVIKNIQLIREYIKTIFSLSPLFLAISGYIVWSYLNELGRLDIFPIIINSSVAFLTALLAFFVLSLLLFILFFLPSLMIIMPSIFLGDKRLEEISIRKVIPFQAMISYMFVIMLSSCSYTAKIAWLSDSHVFWIIAFLIFILNMIYFF